MGIENDVTKDEDKNYEDEKNSETNGELGLEGEFVCDLKELRKLIKKNQTLKEKLQEYEE